MYVGRFAPSPTGPLHFGSLVAARRAGSTRAPAAAAGSCASRTSTRRARSRALPTTSCARSSGFGLTWDGRGPLSEPARRALSKRRCRGCRRARYWCGCTRREIADSALGLAADGAQIYPGTCRAGLPAGKAPRTLRLDVGRQTMIVRRPRPGPAARRILGARSRRLRSVSRGRPVRLSARRGGGRRRAGRHRRGARRRPARLDRPPDPSAAAARLSARRATCTSRWR